MALLNLAAKRLIAQRVLAVALVITMAFAIAVLVAGPIYASASHEAILNGEIAQSDASVKDVRFTLNPQAGLALDRVESQVGDQLHTLPQQHVTFMERTPTLNVVGPRGSLGTFLLYRDLGLRDVRFVQGTAPTQLGELAVPAEDRTLLGGVGDALQVSNGSGASLTYRITGLYLPPALSDQRWFGDGEPFPRPFVPGRYNPSPSTVPLLAVRAGVDQAVSQLRLDGSQRLDWDVYLRVQGATLDRLAQIPPRIDRVLQRLRSAAPGLNGLTTTTGLGALVDQVRQLTNSVDLPIYLVVFQMAAVALAVLAGVASLSLSNQGFELAVLKSRGFSRRQLLLAQTLQSGIAAAAALPLGLGLGILLARLGWDSRGPLLPNTHFQASLSFSALMIGLAGALAGVLLIALVSLPAVSRTVLEERRAVSREDRPQLMRFPIELILFPVGLFAYLEARTHGLGPNPTTGALDPLVLLAPTLLLFAASFAVLRLMLWGLRRADRAIGRISNLPTYLVGRRLSRSASVGLASSLLLFLSAGLLVISSSYRATTLKSYSDLAHQQLGADVQLIVDSSPQSLRALRRLPRGTTGVFTGQTTVAGGPTENSTENTAVNTIGIDPVQFPQAGWWRGDYSSRSLPDLMKDLDDGVPGVPVRAGPLTMDVTTGADLDGYRLIVTVLRPDGAIATALSAVLQNGRHTYAGSVPAGGRVLSITIGFPGTPSDPVRLTINATDDRPGLPGGVTWQSIPWLSSQTHVGRGQSPGSVLLDIQPGSGQVIGGVVAPMPPVPVLASADLVAFSGRKFDGVLSGMQFSLHVADVVNGFPGAPAGQPFFVAPEAAILGRLQAIPGSSPGLTQVWATRGSDPIAAAHRAGLVVDAATTAASLERTFAINPQSLALGMHFTAAAGAMVLVVVGVAVGLYFVQRRRRYEFATLRAFGTDRRTILRMMVGEQAAIVGFSLVTSFMLAWWLLELMMPILGPSITSAFPTPVLAMDWPAVAVFALAVTAAAAVSLALALQATLATSVTSVLRGEVE